MANFVSWTKVFKHLVVCGIIFLLRECSVECRGSRGGRYRAGGGGSAGGGSVTDNDVAAYSLWWVGLVVAAVFVTFLLILVCVLTRYYNKHGHYCCTSDADLKPV